MRTALIFGIALCAALTTDIANAQGPFGPFGPRGAFRPPMPPMPPMPMPAVRMPVPTYVRVPGLTVVPAPRVVVPVPAYNYYRATAIVPVVVQPSYSAARVAVVQPNFNAPNTGYQPGSGLDQAGVYQAGRSSYRTAPPPTNQIGRAPSSSSSDLQPGMVLPDGAVVVSVGQAGAAGSQPTPASQRQATPAPAVPTPAPVTPTLNSTTEPQSILEELPRPIANEGAPNPSLKQF